MSNIKGTKELRAFLVEQMEGIADGTIDAVRAKGVANLSQQIYNTINLELKFASAKAKLGEAMVVKPVQFDE